MPLSLATYKTTNASYFPLVSSKPAWKLDFSGNVWDAVMDYLVANAGTGNGTVTNTGTLTATALVAGNGSADVKTPYASLTIDGTGLMTFGGTAKIALASWTAPSLNVWTNFGSGNVPAGYLIDALGFVHIQGIITGGTTTTGFTIFTLPVGYRPTSLQIFAAPVASGSGLVALFTVDTSGNVKVYNSWSGITTVGLVATFSTT